jgi:alkanesulfonate monooxygenase SsuD/methylene tetrahydromethanopterin reductase-like flavin-dependent oxidoreductase (luciferase family)
MQVGMTLPVMEPHISGEALEAWALAVDDGPFSSLCFGERIVFDNPDALTLLGACAAWTRRVRLTATVIVPQFHDPVMLAKALATADALSGGRVSVAFGVGGREEDYDAADAAWSTRTMAEMADRVATMRRVWAGEPVRGGPRPIGPAPVRPGGPEVLVGTLGPKTIRSAAAWADGLAGMSLAADPDEIGTTFDLVREAWTALDRPAPRLTTSFWFALGDDAREQVNRHLRHYFTWLPADLVEAMAPGFGFAGTPVELRDLFKRIEDTGADEVQLIPTSDDLAQVEQVAELLG